MKSAASAEKGAIMLSTVYRVVNRNVDDVDLCVNYNPDDYVIISDAWNDIIDYLKRYDDQELTGYSILEIDIADDRVSDPVGIIAYAADVFIRNFDKNIVKVQAREV